MTATDTPAGSDAPLCGERTSPADPVHDMVRPSAGISSRRCLSFPEVSSGVWAHAPTEYRPGRNATASSMSTEMNYKHPSDSRVPPASRQRQRSQPPQPPLQNDPPTAPVVPPLQNSYRTPYQGASGTLAPALTDPSAHPTSALPVTQRGGIVGHQRTQSDVHPHQHAVHSPPFAFPLYMGSPTQEENMHHLAYIPPSMITALPPHAPVYQYGTPPDLVPIPPYILPPSVSAPTSPIYPQTNTSPPPHSPSTLRHSMSGPISGPHHSTPYAVYGAYTPIGYTTPPSYAYPASFVPAPSIYGSHCPPPHHSRPYGFPTGQQSQGMWWYSPPGSTVAFNSVDGTQREFQPRATAGYHSTGQLDGEPPDQPNTASLPFEPQPTRRPATRARVSRPLNEAKQDLQSAPSPTPPTSARTRHQERRSYHPNPPGHRSEWVMWAGNVPSDITQDELRDFFNQPLPSAELGNPPKDRQQEVYGGVSTVFLILQSNCAFVNFDSEAQLEAATARFNGLQIRPDDQWCPRLVCRVRRREDDLMSGVGAQRGSGMHIKWVKEQRARIQRGQTDMVASLKDLVRSSSPLSVSSDDSGGIGEGHVGTHAKRSRSASTTSTNSDILTRYFPQRYFILKSLTQYDLDLSVQKNIWATQRHNQEILDQAYRTSKDVFLIFSVNKSGEFYGYARMAGPILREDDNMPWTSATGSTPSSESSLSELSAGSSPSPPDDTAAERPDSLYILTTDEHQQVTKQTLHSAPAGRPSFTLAESQKPYDRLAHSVPNTSTTTGPPCALDPIPASSSNLSSDPSPRAPPTGGTRESAGHEAEPEVSQDDIGGKPKLVSEVPMRGDGNGTASWDRPFRIEWIRTDALPFFRTRQVRNPWNHGREVKVSRDGTELEPTVGRQMLDEWDRPFVVAIDNSTGPSRTPAPALERRRAGAKSTT